MERAVGDDVHVQRARTPGVATPAEATRPQRATVPLWLIPLIAVGALPLALWLYTPYRMGSGDWFFPGWWWTVGHGLAVTLPVVLAALLLAMGRVRSRSGPVIAGLLVGASLVTTQNVVTYGAQLLYSPYLAPGPTWWTLLLGFVLVAPASVAVLRRPPLTAKVAVRWDWRLIGTLVVIVCAIISMATQSVGGAFWLQVAILFPTVLLGAIAVCLTVLRLNGSQRVAALVAVSAVGLGVITHLYWMIAASRGMAPPLLCTLLIVAACYLVQIDWVRRRRETLEVTGPDGR